MSYPMTRDEILKALGLHNGGMPFDRIGAAIGRNAMTVSRHVKNYQIFGDSYFTDYPQRIDRANNS